MDISILVAWSCVFIAAGVLIIAAAVAPLWERRRLVAEAVYAILLVGFTFSLVASFEFGIMQLAETLLASSLIFFLAARLQFGRQAVAFLRRSTFLSAVSLLGVFLITWLLVALLPWFGMNAVVLVLLIIIVNIASILLAQTLWGRQHFSFKSHAVAVRDLPTVTLAIAARNETHALTDCLETALQSTYPKLEIIVLDDCSQDKTSQLIRSFAHAGVRFIQGEVPDEKWVGKTHAYQTLLGESLGEYVLYVGVDTRLAPDTISQMINYVLHYKLSMLSVLPAHRNRFALPLLLQPLRYIWQIGQPFSRQHTPVSSECWLIERTTLRSMSGFTGLRHKILPEAALARQLLLAGRYRFLLASRELQLTYRKKWSSLLETSVRLLYPNVRRQPVRALLLSVLLLFAGLGPLLIFLLGSNVWLQIAALITQVLLYVTYAVLLTRLQPASWGLSFWLLPLVLVQEAVLLLVSTLQYEFGQVDWKGRNICYPVLRQD